MKTTRIILTSLLIALLGHSIQGQAEDIDLYSSASSVTGTDLPNVLFVLDNSANWNANAPACTYADGTSPNLGTTSGGIEQCALVNAINALPVKADGTAVVNIGFMIYNKSGLTCFNGAGTTVVGANIGGCLMVQLTPMTAANKASLTTTIKGWSAAIQANEATAQAMQESWAYYAGKTGMSGTTYTSPALAGCAKNYVIFIGNAATQSTSPGDSGATPGAQLSTTITGNTALTTAQAAMLSATIQIPSGSYGTSAFTCKPSYTMPNHTDVSGLYADEWARYMYDVDLKLYTMPASRRITTYTIGVLSDQCKPDYPALLTSMATQGGGKYFPTSNATDITQAILRVLNEVQAVNSVFSSSSLPVSVNTQGTYLNQIFMGMFRPDSAGTPRWKGNLKQYQFNYDPTAQQLFLADATGTAAISAAGTGFLSPNAASFWTCTSASNTTNQVTPYNLAPYSTTSLCSNAKPTAYTDPAVGFWANMPNSVGLSWDLPDGEVVEKGGAAQMLRLANLTDNYTTNPGSSTNPRNLYTYCPSGTSCVASLSNPNPNPNAFDTSNAAITDAMLGTGSVAISSITSFPTVQGTYGANGGNTAAASITIPSGGLSKTGSTVTATVSAADLAKLAVGTQLSIATGANKYDCNPCTVATINTTTNTFTYPNSNNGGNPTLPSTATVLSNFFFIYMATAPSPSLNIGQTLTISGCTHYTTLNGTIATVALSPFYAPSPNFIDMAVSVSIPSTDTTQDTGCKYTLNTATVTTATAHGFPPGASISISGTTATSSWTTCSATTCYNGTWTIAVTGTNQFTYQYASPAPLSNWAGGGIATSTLNRDVLTRWVRGEDNFGDEASLCPPGSTAGSGNCPNPAVNIRPSVHGDVLHSRPVVINYGGSAITITATSDSGSIRTATASAADVAGIGATGAQANVTFANGTTCPVTVASTTTFTYSTTGCGAAGAQPAATATANVVVFYGGNDGVFRAVNGNQVNPLSSSSSFTLPDPGGELWGFIPTEFYSKLKRQHDNSPALWMPSTPPGIIPTPQRKDYFVDGSTGIYQVIDGTGRTTKAYLYLAMRRGGRFFYALDVTNPTAPQFLWKHSNADTGFGELGQTWSQPKVAQINGYANPVLIFGAGYDNVAEDVEPPTADTMGRGIFILDATTGALVWKATYGAALSCPSATAACTLPAMKYSIPSDITLIDRNSDGKIDRLYVGDVGGNMWRVDLEPTNKTNTLGNTCTATTQTACTPDIWQVEKLAALGCTAGVCASGIAPRKIFYPPEVITTNTYDAVFTATGDREHPLYTTNTISITGTADSGSTRTATASAADVAKIGAVGATNNVTFANNSTCTVTVASTTTFTYSNSGCGASGAQNAATIALQSACAVTNRAYFLEDVATGMDGSGLTTITESNLFDATATPWNGSLSGYYVTFNKCEKSVNAPLVVAGKIYFGTNQAQAPSNQRCEETLGEATGYSLTPFTGVYVAGEYEGGGMPPSPVAGVVNITLASGKTIEVPFCIGCGGEADGGSNGCGSQSALAGCKPPISVSSTRSRTYWYIKDK